MEQHILTTQELFEPGHTRAWAHISGHPHPWDILAEIRDIIREIGETLPPDAYDHPADGIWIAKSARIAPTAYIGGPAIIGEETEVRHGAFIRGSALVGDGCVVGNSVELKNCILFDGVQVPHYNYVGDSVLGYKAHMGAGSVTSNVKSDKTLVTVRAGDQAVETRLKKMGAILGDRAEVGCNAVLNPGTVIGAGARIYPLTSVRGTVPAGCILKSGKGTELVHQA